VRTTSTQNERKSRCVLLNRDFFLSSTDDDACVFCACDSRARDDEKNEVSSVSNNNERERGKETKKKRTLISARAKALRDALVYVRVCVCIHT